MAGKSYCKSPFPEQQVGLVRSIKRKRKKPGALAKRPTPHLVRTYVTQAPTLPLRTNQQSLPLALLLDVT